MKGWEKKSGSYYRYNRKKQPKYSTYSEIIINYDVLKGSKLAVSTNFEILDLRNYLMWTYGSYNSLKHLFQTSIDNSMLISKLNFAWSYRNVIEFLSALKDHDM